MNQNLVFENVTRDRLQKDGSRELVLDKLNLTIEAGCHLAVIGGSGVGKTTLLRLANRLEEPDSGRVIFADRPLTSWEVTTLRQKVSLVLQTPCLFPLTVLENVVYIDRASNRTPDFGRARELLEFVGLEPHYFERSGEALSVGQMHRACLARALYKNPDVLMMDESTASMDPNLADLVLDNLCRLSKEKGVTLIHVTHEIAKIKLADRVILLEKGKIFEDGAPGQVLANPSTQAGRRFLGME